MKKLLLTCMLFAPFFAAAESLRFNALGDSLKFRNHNLSAILDNDNGQFGSYTTVRNTESNFAVRNLGGNSSKNYSDQNLHISKQTINQNSFDRANSNSLDNNTFRAASFGKGHQGESTLNFVMHEGFVERDHSYSRGGYNNGIKMGSLNFLSDSKNKAGVPDIKDSPSAVPAPAALPLLATAIGLFGFAANRRRV